VSLGEPSRSPYDLNFSLLGIPVRVHPMFWLVTLLLGMHRRDLTSLLAWIAAVFLGILIHELGHALAMRAYGFAPWITLHGFGGLTAHASGGSYRSAGYSSLGQIMITIAGPGAGFLFAALLVVLLRATGHPVAIVWLVNVIPFPALLDFVGSQALRTFIQDLLFISVLWGVINLLPVYPLDGGQISREVFLRINPREGIRASLILSIIAATGMAIFAITQWHSVYTTLFFAYLAYSSYVALQSYMGRGPF
jgi:Zn-dependent protease